MANIPQILGRHNDDARNILNLTIDTVNTMDGTVTKAQNDINNFINGTGTVNRQHLAANSVDGNALADETVFTRHLRLGAVTDGKVADGAITKSKVRDGAVTNSKLGTRSVSWDKLDEGAVTNSRISDDAVNTPKIEDGAVNRDKIADGAVTENHISIRSIGNHHIKDAAVNSSRIADYSILERHLTANMITKSMLKSGAVDHTKTVLDTMTINKGKVFPMQKIGKDDKPVILDAVLDIKVQFAEVGAQYSLNYIGKDTTSWGEAITFIEMSKSYDGFVDSILPLIGRNQTEQQAIGNNQRGVKSHVIQWEGMEEVITVTIDWDVLTSPNNNFKTGADINYIISPSQYFFRRTSKEEPTEDLEGHMAFSINGRDIKVKEELNNEENIVYEFGTLSPNDFFEITRVKTQSSSASIEDYSGSDLLRSSTDWVSPYGMLAENNTLSDSKFTVGGGHGTNGGAGFPTGTFIGIYDVKVDGVSVSDGDRIGDVLTFRIEHYVSASNVINLETGEKRNTAKETRHYQIDKSGIHVEVSLEALEPITLTHYAGLQTIQRDAFDYFYYRGDEPRKLYTVTGLTNWELPTLDDPALLDRVVMYNPDIVMVMHTDRSFGIGTGEFIPESTEKIVQRPMHATPNTGKIYMHNLGRSSNKFKMSANDAIQYRGQWTFTENISDASTVVKYKFNNQEYTDDVSSYEVI